MDLSSLRGCNAAPLRNTKSVGTRFSRLECEYECFGKYCQKVCSIHLEIPMVNCRHRYGSMFYFDIVLVGLYYRGRDNAVRNKIYSEIKEFSLLHKGTSVLTMEVSINLCFRSQNNFMIISLYTGWGMVSQRWQLCTLQNRRVSGCFINGKSICTWAHSAT